MGRARDEAGNIWETDAQGNPVRLVTAAGGPQMPADPTFPLKAPQVQSEIGKNVAQTNNANANATGQNLQNTVTQATIPAQVNKAAADAVKAQLEAQGGSANVRQDAITQYNGAAQLEAIADNLEKQYNESFKGKGLGALKEYNPFRAENKVFNDTADQARGFVKNALGYTGGEGNTIGEVQLNYGPYLPQNGDRDEQIVQKIGALRALAARARQRSVETLGGVPNPDGTISPLTPRGGPGSPPQVGAPTPFDNNPSGAMQSLATGATRSVSMTGLNAGLNGLVQQGAPYSQAAAFAQQNHIPVPSPQEYTAALAWQRAHPHTPYNASNIHQDVPTTGFQRFAASPTGAAIVGAADMGSFGGLRAIAGDQLNDLAATQPIGTAIGQVGGALAGTTGLAKLGGALVPNGLSTALAGRLSPKALDFAKNLATDTAYGGIYGGVSGDGVGQDALAAAGGSVLGQGLGRGLGAVVGGAAQSPAVQFLRNRNIPMTIGQRMGGPVKAIEDAATSVPIVGDMIGRRYRDSLAGLSREGLSEAGKPIGFVPTEIGKAGVEQTGDAIGNYYDNVTAGANVPLDPQYPQDFAAVVAKGQALPDDLRHRFNLALQNRVNPINNAGAMTGESYQQAVRGLKSYKGETTKPGFEQDYRDALTAAQQALRDQMVRGGGQAVTQGLDNADQAYRIYKTFENAAGRADGAGYIPTASQLQDAIKATGKKFPGANPLSALADNAQEVLPSKVPDSGTARRLLNYGLGASLLGAGQASDSYLGTDVVNPYTVGALALLTAGGSRVGQKALGTAIFDRPDALKRAGELIRQRKGLFGSAAIPLAMLTAN